jgi:hypothetical protein
MYPIAINAPERIDALGCVLTDVSSVLDRLLAEDILTTNFLRADDGVRKYVPDYCFKFVREAAACLRYDEVIRDHRPFIDTMAFFIERTVAEATLHPLLELRNRLGLLPRGSEEHAGEMRALHMRKMLYLGWGLLDETATNGLWGRDPELARRSAEAHSSTYPPLPYATRTDVVLEAVAVLEKCSLAKEAAAARGFLNFNPAIHG